MSGTVNISKSKQKKTSRTFSSKTLAKRELILKNKRQKIMKAALDLFSKQGIKGTRVEQIAELAGVSKTNLLYYFKNKEQLYLEVITQLLEVWLTPLQSFSAEQEAVKAITQYIKVKLELSRDNPAESKLFCMELLQGAPLITSVLNTNVQSLVKQKAQVIQQWIDQGKLKPIDPYHLIFSIWAITQHYADFNVQILAVTGKDLHDPDFFNSTLQSITQLILNGITDTST
jgi:TetR/AcrR family transcriptional regulator